MNQPLVCMTLTGKTLEENVKLVNKYKKSIDLVELRVDLLNEDEQLYARRFPSMIRHPCILAIRRDIDGGLFTSGEFSRTNLFARALAYANQDKAKNFAYVDFEEDFHIPSIQDAAMAFGVRIIRSCHNLKGPVFNLQAKCESMRKTGYEIPKIVFTPSVLSDVGNIFNETKNMPDFEHIFVALGNLGLPTRILPVFTDSYITYTLPEDICLNNSKNYGLIDPITLNNLYKFKSITKNTKIFGITGWPITKTTSPEIHNAGFKKLGIDAVYLPIRSPLVSEAINFAETVGINGMSITTPHNESVLYYLNEQSPEVLQVGTCNCIVRKDNKWIGYNTDIYGFKRSLLEFLGPIKLKYKKVAVIGAGVAAKSIAFVLKQLGAKVCIFNRNISHAKQIAEKYGFKSSELNPSCAPLLDEYSFLIIQTTVVGSITVDKVPEVNDPIYFYNFRGNELLYDVICKPAITPLMKRASLAGCRVSNGHKMLEYQSYAQFKLFTNQDFEESPDIDTIF